MEDRDVELGAQALLDLEAAWGGDVLEVDPAERRRDGLADHHDLVHVLRVEADREAVDPGEVLEQGRLALHHRHRRRRPDVAQAQHGRAVGDDRDRVALDGERAGVLGVVVDGHADACDAGRVGHRQVVAGLERHGRDHLELPAEVHQERAVADLVDLDAVDRADRGLHAAGLLLVTGVDRQVKGELRCSGVHHVDRDDDPAGLADGGRDAAECRRVRGRHA